MTIIPKLLWNKTETIEINVLNTLTAENLSKIMLIMKLIYRFL